MTEVKNLSILEKTAMIGAGLGSVYMSAFPVWHTITKLSLKTTDSNEYVAQIIAGAAGLSTVSILAIGVGASYLTKKGLDYVTDKSIKRIYKQIARMVMRRTLDFSFIDKIAVTIAVKMTGATII